MNTNTKHYHHSAKSTGSKYYYLSPKYYRRPKYYYHSAKSTGSKYYYLSSNNPEPTAFTQE
jgi:hypothetical protein